MVRSAEEAWADYLDLTTRDAWTAEADLNRQRLLTIDSDGYPANGSPDWSPPTGYDLQPARVSIQEDLLPTWAEHWLAGREREAADSLENAQDVAAKLTAITGDQLLTQIIQDIRAAVAQHPRTADRYASGLLDYRKARSAHEEQRYEEAARGFDAAAHELETTRNPFSLWPRFYAAVIAFHQMNNESALASFEPSCARATL